MHVTSFALSVAGERAYLPKWDVSGMPFFQKSNLSDDGTAITAHSHLLFSADDTYDIGAENATRPHGVYLKYGLAIGGNPLYNQGISFPNDYIIADTGRISLGHRSGGFWLDLNSSEVVVNDGGLSMDFRVEGDTNANLFFVDGSADAVGIGTATPGRPLDVVDIARISNPAGATATLEFYLNALRAYVSYNDTTSVMRIDSDADLLMASNNVERINLKASSEVVVNDTGADFDFRIEGDTNANLFFLDASTDRIGVGTASPNAQLSTTGKVMIGNVDLSGVMLEAS